MSFGDPYKVTVASPTPSVLIVCEHASHYIPAELNNLGVTEEVAHSHVAWDPGALGVARAMAGRLPSVLVEGTVSRLVYDCNRPPEAASAIPARSEIFEIPGNRDLTADARAQRVAGVYDPFARALSQQIAAHRGTLTLMVTIHSFTPVFHGVPREVEIGILHGEDTRFARAMLGSAPADAPYDTRLNEPYAARDGVAHTLDLHGAQNGLCNVMIEIRNDLIATAPDQEAMATYLSDWTERTWESLGKQEEAS